MSRWIDTANTPSQIYESRCKKWYEPASLRPSCSQSSAHAKDAIANALYSLSSLRTLRTENYVLLQRISVLMDSASDRWIQWTHTLPQQRLPSRFVIILHYTDINQQGTRLHRRTLIVIWQKIEIYVVCMSWRFISPYREHSSQHIRSMKSTTICSW